MQRSSCDVVNRPGMLWYDARTLSLLCSPSCCMLQLVSGHTQHTTRKAAEKNCSVVSGQSALATYGSTPRTSELRGLIPGPCESSFSTPTHSADTLSLCLDWELPYDMVASRDDRMPCIRVAAAVLSGPELADAVPSIVSQGTGVPGIPVGDDKSLPLPCGNTCMHNCVTERAFRQSNCTYCKEGQKGRYKDDAHIKLIFLECRKQLDRVIQRCRLLAI